MRRTLIAALAIAAGLVVGADFFVQHPALRAASSTLTDWVTILVSIALFLGLWNVLQSHGTKVMQRDGDSVLSLALIASMAVVLFLGLRPGSWGPLDDGVSWLFRYVYVPLNATVFSLLAFFVASAAFRALRARSAESTLLLTVAVLVLLGQVPIGFQLWPDLPLIKDWLLQVLAAAGFRGILLGVALGTIAAGLRLLVGQDRPYLGGGRK